tara:strand:+ start:281 stop:661 length:381 start_codon:yes stop_codon:yes gene_type:complete
LVTPEVFYWQRVQYRSSFCKSGPQVKKQVSPKPLISGHLESTRQPKPRTKPGVDQCKHQSDYKHEAATYGAQKARTPSILHAFLTEEITNSTPMSSFILLQLETTAPVITDSKSATTKRETNKAKD